MKKKIVIHIENLTAAHEVLLQDLLQSLCVEQSKMLEDTTFTLLVGEPQIYVQRHPGQLFSARQIYESVASDCAEGSWSEIGNIVYKLRCKIGSEASER